MTSQSRTMTLLAGDAGPHMGGSFVIEARLKAAAPGTIIVNRGLIYFPNALQQLTPTNSVVSAVPLPTQLAYSGPSSGVYLSTAGLSGVLTAGPAPLSHQRIDFNLASAAQPLGSAAHPLGSASAFSVTNASGQASASVFLSAAAGGYGVALSYPGDGFYYLPTSAAAGFSILKRPTILQAPFATGRATDTIRLALTLTDDRGRALVRQIEEPKTVYLELFRDAVTSKKIVINGA